MIIQWLPNEYAIISKKYHNVVSHDYNDIMIFFTMIE